MAVAIEMTFRGATLDMYDQVIQKMGLVRGGTMPPGGIFHWVAETPDGLRVVDVWETRDQFDRFAEEQIGPYSQEAGFPGPPEIQAYELHNDLSAS